MTGDIASVERGVFSSPRRKIVMLCDFYDHKCHYQENLFAKYYAKHGHAVTVLASTFDDAFDYINDRYDPSRPMIVDHQEGVKVIRLPYSINILHKLRKFGGVDAILEAEQPDVIFSHDIHLNLAEAARYKQRHPECRVIMDYHADYSNSAKNWLSLNVLHKVIRRAFLYRHKPAIDGIYPVVPASADFLHEVYGVSYDEMTILPLAADIDLARATIASGVGRSIRARLGIAPDAVVVFTGGKFTPTKRTDLLFEAIRSIEQVAVHLIAVGESMQPEYAARLRELASHPRIHTVGWVDGSEVYHYMNACDLAVFPASQSVLWQQALTMGLPIVVGQVGVQDARYLNLYDNVVTVAERDIRTDVLARIITDMATDRGRLSTAQSGARRVADEILNYHRQVPFTLGETTDATASVGA